MENKTQSHEISTVTYNEDKFAYKGWMNSDKFLKRAFGVFGYQMVAGCIIQVAFMIIGMIFFAVFGVFFNNMLNSLN